MKLDLFLACPLFKVLVICSILDIITGTYKGFYNKNLSSSISKKGITNHIIVLFVVVGMTQVFHMLKLTEFGLVLKSFYIFSHIISIIENMHEVGIPFPVKIKKHFQLMKGELENETSDTTNRE